MRLGESILLFMVRFKNVLYLLKICFLFKLIFSAF